MNVQRARDVVGRATPLGAVIASGSKGGRRQNKKMEMFRWGMGGGYGRPSFLCL
jgi:hypothetical protein